MPRHPHTRLSAQAAFFTDDLLVRALDLLLAPDRQHVIVERHLDILLSDAGQLGADFQLFFSLADIDAGHQHPALAALAFLRWRTEGTAQDIVE